MLLPWVLATESDYPVLGWLGWLISVAFAVALFAMLATLAPGTKKDDDDDIKYHSEGW